MFNNLTLPADIKIDGQTLELVNNYVYLGQLFSINTDSEIEIQRRISYAWSKLGKLSQYLQDQRYPLALKKKIFQQCVVPVFMYGSETWTVTKKNGQETTCSSHSNGTKNTRCLMAGPYHK